MAVKNLPNKSANGLGIIVADWPEPKSKQRSNPSVPPITTHPQILSGTPVLGGTRIPVTDFIDHLLDGETVQDFVAGHPSISAGDVAAVLLLIRDELERGWLAQEIG